MPIRTFTIKVSFNDEHLSVYEGSDAVMSRIVQSTRQIVERAIRPAGPWATFEVEVKE